MKRMANLQNWRIISVFFLGLWCAAASAWGEPIIVQVTGVVNSIDFPTDSIQVGSSMVGFCSYDTETPDEDPSDNRGTYDLNHLSMAIGDYIFTRNSASSEPAVFDVWKTDITYRAQCFYGIATESGLPLSFYKVHIKLIDLCNASVGGPDDLLPVTFPDISFFTWRNKFEVTFSQSGTGYQIQGELTSIEVVSEPPLPRVIYVDDDAPAGGDGLSWPTAYKHLQDGLDDADPCDVIWVAAGTYNPTSGTGRYKTFKMKNGVAIYGGFVGTENSLVQRDVQNNETILSGDLNGDDIEVEDTQDFWTEPSRSDNSYHVVTGSGTNQNTALDGFTITAGNANGSYPHYYGGGMRNSSGSPTVANCIFADNYSYQDGAGMFNYQSSPTVTNCTFMNNFARDDGGGMINKYNSNPILANCTFTSNSADFGGGIHNLDSNPTVKNCAFTANLARVGGGMCNEHYSHPIVSNCTFSGNSADWNGGGMSNDNSYPTVTNCTFSGNSANSGGGMGNALESWPTLTNCIFTGNSADNEGGGMFNYRTFQTVTNCTFTDNSADKGGMMVNYASSPQMSNCTFVGNSATNGNALACDSSEQSPPSTVQMTNCILWDGGEEIWNNDGSTITITYSDVDGGWTGEGNIDADPLFVDPNGPDGVVGTEDDNLRLFLFSPCIDVGDNSVVDPCSTDLDGNPRIINDTADMGAYEAPVSIETDMHIVPRTINRANRMKRIMAIIRLPEGISKYDVADVPFVLYAGDSDSDGIKAVWQRVIGWRRRARVFALFDKDELIAALPEYSRVELTVVGKLESGQYIHGSDTVRIVQPRRRRARGLCRRWR